MSARFRRAMVISRRILKKVTRTANTGSAILAGAAAATAALSLILLMLGTGLELSSVSPWAFSGVSSTTFGVSAILWLTFTQLVAPEWRDGYLTGKLRIKWGAVHTDEVYFRDTAQGFLFWAVAALATAALKKPSNKLIKIGYDYEN